MKKKINLFFYGDTGIFDALSPAFICSEANVPELLYLIAANEPYTLSLSF